MWVSAVLVLNTDVPITTNRVPIGPYQKPGSINAARAVLILTGGAGSINAARSVLILTGESVSINTDRAVSILTGQAAHFFAHGHIKTRAVSKLSVITSERAQRAERVLSYLKGQSQLLKGRPIYSNDCGKYSLCQLDHAQ